MLKNKVAHHSYAEVDIMMRRISQVGELGGLGSEKVL